MASGWSPWGSKEERSLNLLMAIEGAGRRARGTGGGRRACTSADVGSVLVRPVGQPPAPRPLCSVPSWFDLDRRTGRHRAPDLVDFAVRHRDAAGGPVAEPLRAAEKSEAVREAVDHDVAPGRGAGAVERTRIGDVQSLVEAAGGVLCVDRVEALGGFVVAFALLGAGGIRAEGDRVGLQGLAVRVERQAASGFLYDDAVGDGALREGGGGGVGPENERGEKCGEGEGGAHGRWDDRNASMSCFVSSGVTLSSISALRSFSRNGCSAATFTLPLRRRAIRAENSLSNSAFCAAGTSFVNCPSTSLCM